MNVKEHKWLVWVMIISLVSGMWSGSVARGENKNSPEKTEQVREITQVEIGMDEPELGEQLPSQVTVQEVQVESSTIEIISVESATVETISWDRRKNENEKFQKIDGWQAHHVEDNTEYKVEITLKAEGCKFKEGVKVDMGEKLYDKLENSDEGKSVTVSWNFTFGKVPEPTPTPPTKTTSPTTPTPTSPPKPTPSVTPTAVPTPTPSSSVMPTQPPVTTEKPAQSALPTKEPSPDTPPIETALPLVSPSPSLVPPVTTYTVTLEANGGTVSQKSISFTAEEVSKIKLPKPIRKKYVFIGWYEGKKRVEKLTELRNITLKAQWVTASVDMGYLGTLKWEKFKLSSDVKLTEVSIEKKYKKFVRINNKKKTLKGKKKKYFKKAKLTLKIDGKNVEGVVLKMKLPEAKIKIKKAGKRRRYVIGVYRTYELAYAYKPGATGAVAEYSYKKEGKYKKCVKALNRLKGGSVSVKKGRTVYMRVKIYYGKNDYSKSKPKPLKG